MTEYLGVSRVTVLNRTANRNMPAIKSAGSGSLKSTKSVSRTKSGGAAEKYDLQHSS